MSPAPTRTKASSQIPASRAAPRGSVGSRTQRGSWPRSNVQDNPVTSIGGSGSRADRTSWPSSRPRGMSFDAEARRKSTISFAAPSVKPSDSISRVKSRPSGGSRDFTAVNNGKASTKYSPADVRYRSGRRTSLPGTLSHGGTAWSGSAVPLTKTNLEVHNADRTLIAARRDDGDGERTTREAPQHHIGPPGSGAAWALTENRRRSLRYSDAAGSDESPMGTRGFLGKSRPSSRNYEGAVGSQPPYGHSQAIHSGRMSHQHPSALNEQTEPTTTSRRPSTKGIDKSSASKDVAATAALGAESSALTRRAANASSYAHGDRWEAHTGATTQPHATTERPFSEKQTTEVRSKDPSSALKDASTKGPAGTTSHVPERQSSVNAAGEIPSAPKSRTTAPSETPRTPQSKSGGESRQVKASMPHDPVGPSGDETTAPFAEASNQQVAASQSSSPNKRDEKDSKSQSMTRPTAPNAPMPPMWRERTHIIKERRPDGQILEDKEHIVKSGRYVAAH